ncbi:MAG: 2-succinyl-5-enolpyruvyl-6-hydroxy-3-cyclohexene-1-carboxylic-acid synthase [Cytophagales bacterium]|nr:2-succinyl-5-enolpyruvyl-6-hydroxy-3-cyclohexene-1-carboxylic-acid synthase [Cytophagales bacterium]
MDYSINIAPLLQSLGLTHVIVCPGSRSAPLTIAFARTAGITCKVVFDERSAGYIALGIAAHLQKPVAVITTSGTAAINLYPAVAEAYFQQIPLLIITADRPPEWIGQREGQSVYQDRLYGFHAKNYYSLPVDKIHSDAKYATARMAQDAYNEAYSLPYGPVHINVPLREPLYPQHTDSMVYDKSIIISKKHSPTLNVSDTTWKYIEKIVSQNTKIVILAGQQVPDDSLNIALVPFLKNITIIGEPLSNIQSEGIINSCFQALFAHAGEELKPDILITIGANMVSKAIKQYFTKYKPAHHLHIGIESRFIDPMQTITQYIPMKPSIFFVNLIKNININPDIRYYEAWHNIYSSITKTKYQYLDNHASDAELIYFYHIINALPERVALHLSNSLPIRYLNYVSKLHISYYCNRGTSGIDGCTSTAVGYTWANTALTNILITGDMAFLYDKNALWHNDIPDNLKIIVFNNHSGGIFHTLPGPKQLPENSTYFAGHQPYGAQHIAAHYGIGYTLVQKLDEFQITISAFLQKNGCHILEIETDAQLNAQYLSDFEKHLQLS